MRVHGKTVIGSTVIVEMQRAGTYKRVYCRYMQLPFRFNWLAMQPGVQWDSNFFSSAIESVLQKYSVHSHVFFCDINEGTLYCSLQLVSPEGGVTTIPVAYIELGMDRSALSQQSQSWYGQWHCTVQLIQPVNKWTLCTTWGRSFTSTAFNKGWPAPE